MMPARTPWTTACLSCNETWAGDKPHACSDAQEYRREFWVLMLRWAMPNATIVELRAIVARPIKRERMAELLGEKWRGDSLEHMPMHNPSFLPEPTERPEIAGTGLPFDISIPREPTPRLHGQAAPRAATRRAAARKRA